MTAKYPYWPEYTDEQGDAVHAYLDDTCGDCVEGRCHWGGDTSQSSIVEAAAGRDYEDSRYGRCGCARHTNSVAARRYRTGTLLDTALAWRAAKDSGEIVAEDDDAEEIWLAGPIGIGGDHE